MLESLPYSSAAACVAGGLLILDRTASFQLMLSRPIVAAPVIGLIMGDPLAALVAGLTIELLFIGDLPVGRYLPVHETGLAVLAAAMTVAALSAPGLSGYGGAYGAIMALPSILLIALPVSWLYQKGDEYARRFNERIYRNALSALESGEDVSLFKENMKGAFAFFITGTVSLLATVVPLALLSRYAFSGIGGRFLFYPAFAGCVALGMAAALNAVYRQKSVYIFSASGVGTAVLWVALA